MATAPVIKASTGDQTTPIGTAVAWQVTSGQIADAVGPGNPLYVQLTATTTGGALVSAALVSAATTNATLVKASAGSIFGGTFSNSGSTWAYLKIFSKATLPVPGTDTPTVVIGLPPGATLGINSSDIGLTMPNGIGFAVTGAPALLDATVVAAGQVVGNLFYI